MKTPKCEECGNDGSEGSLYLTIDAKFRNGVWTLEEREDDGGMELDCLECDHRTPFPGEDGETPFPYGMELGLGHLAAYIVTPEALKAGDELCCLLEDAYTVHIYDLQNDDVPDPKDCPYQQAITAWKAVRHG